MPPRKQPQLSAEQLGATDPILSAEATPVQEGASAPVAPAEVEIDLGAEKAVTPESPIVLEALNSDGLDLVGGPDDMAAKTEDADPAQPPPSPESNSPRPGREPGVADSVPENAPIRERYPSFYALPDDDMEEKPLPCLRSIVVPCKNSDAPEGTRYFKLVGAGSWSNPKYGIAPVRKGQLVMTTNDHQVSVIEDSSFFREV